MSGKILFPDDKEAKRLIIEVGKRMYDKDYCAANDGNISCRTEDGAPFWVTPSGVSKGFMTEDILVKTDLQGNILENRDERRIFIRGKAPSAGLPQQSGRRRGEFTPILLRRPLLPVRGRRSTRPVVSEAILASGRSTLRAFRRTGNRRAGGVYRALSARTRGGADGRSRRSDLGQRNDAGLLSSGNSGILR